MICFQTFSNFVNSITLIFSEPKLQIPGIPFIKVIEFTHSSHTATRTTPQNTAHVAAVTTYICVGYNTADRYCADRCCHYVYRRRPQHHVSVLPMPPFHYQNTKDY